MLKILLVNPLIDPERAYGIRFKKMGAVLPPLGLCYLAGVLEKTHSVQILDANMLNLTNSDIVHRTRGYDPDIIGIYATTMGIHIAEDLASRLKEALPDVTIVIGGPHISGYGKETLACSYFDYGIINEGEYAFLNLVDALSRNGTQIHEIQNIVYRSGNAIKLNPQQSIVEDLDALPFPARHLLPQFGKYHPKMMLSRQQPATHILTSRGCPYRCIFCQTPFGKKVRFHSAEYVVEEIKLLSTDFGIKEIKINDDTFNLDVERVYRICDGLKKEGMELTWSCNIRIDRVGGPSFFKRLKQAGCWLIRPGFESGDQSILDTLKKGTTVEQIKKICKWAYDAGLMIQASFIVGNPHETEKTLENTIDFVRSLPIHYPTFSIMTPFPGTELWENAEAYGTFSYQSFRDLALSHNPTFIPYGLSKKKMLFYHKKAYRKAYLNPNMVIRHVKTVRGFSDLKKLYHAFRSLLT